MLKVSLLFFILSIYHYGFSPSPWLKCIPALALLPLSKYKYGRESLIFAAAGDFFLEFESPWTFGLGVTSFACCQFFLILNLIKRDPLFWRAPQSRVFNCWSVAGGVVISGKLLFCLLSYSALPVTLYSLILLQMVILAIPQCGNSYGIGCLLFALSDFLFLVELILKHMDQSLIPLKIIPTISLPIYWTSLLLIGLEKPTVERFCKSVRVD